MTDAWYIIVKDAETREAREGYQDIENTQPERHNDYRPIPQFDRTYKQTTGVREGVGDDPVYPEVTAATSSQPRTNVDAPPSYSAVVKGGILIIV